MGRSRPAVGYAACMIPVGIFYLMTAGDIGKSVIGLWGAVAVLCGAAAVMAAVRSEGRQIAQFMCALLAAMQLPCLYCWAVFGSAGFEVLGGVLPGKPIFLPGWAALLVHLLLAVWGVILVSGKARLRG